VIIEYIAIVIPQKRQIVGTGDDLEGRSGRHRAGAAGSGLENRVTTPVTTSTASNPSNPSTEPRNLDA
jgi:hypothetical protein